MQWSGNDVGTALVPILIFALPIIAVVGGIASRITRTTARARIQELLIQERIKSIEKGIVPSPQASMIDLGLDPEVSPMYRDHRAFGLRVGGGVALAVGLALMFAMWQTGNESAWPWMTIPAAIGASLLISSFFVPRPIPRDAGSSSPRPGPDRL
jgi:hypothetical protein